MPLASTSSGRSSSSGSFSAAADALSYSQSAVSQAIATLEGEVGATLIERDRGGVRPTAAGAALVTHADGILGRMEAAETELAAIAGGEAGRLRIASFPTAGATLMPLAIAAFSAGHPGVELTLAEGEPEEIAPRLRGGEFDLALLYEFEGVGERLGAGIRRFELLEDPLHLALPSGSPARRAAARSGSRTCARSRGCRPRSPAPARATWCAPATRPASSRASPSRATTTRRCRAWSPPASASP